MTGFYVQRDDEDRIVGKFSLPQPGFAEEFVEGDPELYVAQTWDDIRARRNALLTASDWTQLPDAPLSAEDKEEWAEYRQELRDLTEAENPDDVVFPDAPTA